MSMSGEQIVAFGKVCQHLTDTVLCVETTVNKIENTSDLIMVAVDKSVELLRDSRLDIGKIQKTVVDTLASSGKTLECAGQIHVTVDQNKAVVDTVHRIVLQLQTAGNKASEPAQWSHADWGAYFGHSKLVQEVETKKCEDKWSFIFIQI